MLTNHQLEQMCDLMSIPLERVCFKDQLKEQELKYNKSYIINLEDQFDEIAVPNKGSHWTCFQVNKYPSGRTSSFYFDSYGKPAPTAVKDFIGYEPPYSSLQAQSLMNNACGYFVCSYLHYINAYKERTGNLYADSENFLNLFIDLDKSCDFKYNEYVLKHFFRSTDPNKRKEITLEDIADSDRIIS